jgi:formylglycine-generating enzyme
MSFQCWLVTANKTHHVCHIFVSLCLCCTISLLASPASAVTIAWVPVGNPGNAPDSATGSRYGSVGYAYNIDKYDVTNSQYVEFLNAKDPDGTNLLGLYDSRMSDPSTASSFSGHGGIAFTPGNLAGSKYNAISSNANHPVNYVNWYDAIRFANWLNNGQGNGDTETGAYTLGPLEPGGGGVPANGNSITRNLGARIFLTSQDEWYKAAYYDPRTTVLGGPPGDSHYWLYPTTSNTAPTAEIPPGGSNSANSNQVIGTVGDLTNVGAYTGTMSHYGAFDMGGNTFQMNETFLPALGREVLGGDWFGNSVGMESTFIGNVALTPFLGSVGTGFRVASIATVPEPSTIVLAALAWGLLWWKAKSLRRVANQMAPRSQAAGVFH